MWKFEVFYQLWILVCKISMFTQFTRGSSWSVRSSPRPKAIPPNGIGFQKHMHWIASGTRGCHSPQQILISGARLKLPNSATSSALLWEPPPFLSLRLGLTTARFQRRSFLARRSTILASQVDGKSDRGKTNPIPKLMSLRAYFGFDEFRFFIFLFFYLDDFLVNFVVWVLD